jgi:hypothetical protein
VVGGSLGRGETFSRLAGVRDRKHETSSRSTTGHSSLLVVVVGSAGSAGEALSRLAWSPLETRLRNSSCKAPHASGLAPRRSGEPSWKWNLDVAQTLAMSQFSCAGARMLGAPDARQASLPCPLKLLLAFPQPCGLFLPPFSQQPHNWKFDQVEGHRRS